MTANQNYGAHSANVEMHLIVNGTSVSITHMGPDFVLIEGASDHAPGEATVVLKVDENERHWQVRLPNGIFKNSNRVALASCSLPEPA